jgi:uncharacterized protein
MDRERFEKLETDVWARLSDADPAHDASHVRRVMANARRIAQDETADVDIAVSAALLHELFNYPKGHPDSSRSGEVCADQAAALLAQHGFDGEFVERVTYCIRVHPFSCGIVPETIEAKVLQDADRLDAIGAIGIARCFATTAAMKRPFYAPNDPFCREREPDDKQWGIDHFFQKLLRVAESLHTHTGCAMAEERVRFMRAYLAQLERELG